MKSYETANYIFYFQENSPAERDIIKIAKLQQDCYNHISTTLRVSHDFKIEYYLYETPEEVGHAYGDDEPCSGFATSPNKIYAVYNDEINCLGFHEDAHIISYLINHPTSCAIREGLAMYFDRKWWGIQNLDWTGYFIKTNKYITLKELLNDDIFYSVDCSIAYPIMGAFTEWLISLYGIDMYLEFYKYENTKVALQLVYDKTIEELNMEFVNYMQLFEIDNVLIQRMKEMLND